MTERIDHAAQAVRVLGNFPHEHIADSATALAWAQVHATLALVEQQRIANLISVYGAERRGEDGSKFTPIPEITNAAFDQAIKGLGLS